MRIKSSVKNYSTMNFRVGLYSNVNIKLCMKQVMLKVVFIENGKIVPQINDEILV